MPISETSKFTSSGTKQKSAIVVGKKKHFNSGRRYNLFGRSLRHNTVYSVMMLIATIVSRRSVVSAFSSSTRCLDGTSLNGRRCIDTAFTQRTRSTGTSRLFASKSDDFPDDSSKNYNIPSDTNKKSRNKPKKKKFKVVDEITNANLDRLAKAFEDLSAKEGLTGDDTTAFYADDSAFESEFGDEDYIDFGDEGSTSETERGEANRGVVLDSSQYNLADFVEEAVKPPESFLNTPKAPSSMSKSEYEMEARIRAAQKDMMSGRVSLPEDSFESTMDEVRALGFHQEANPFGRDETPRNKTRFLLISDPLTCNGCGADFQDDHEDRPGFLPQPKYEIQVKLSKISEAQRVADKAMDSEAEWSADEEIDWLLNTSEKDKFKASTKSDGFDADTMAETMGLNLEKESRKSTICKRCHGLQNFGKVEDALRPGWTEEPLLSQQNFRDLLRPIREKKAVLIALVDLFDFAGSVLGELDAIAGENPVIIAANKADLLPSNMGNQRAESWVRRELEYLGIRSLANVGGAVRLVSCKTGSGVEGMLEKARRLADAIDCDIYVVGAANAGKSTLMNRVVGHVNDKEEKKRMGKLRAGNRNKQKSAITTSPLPGTTLKFIKADLGNGRSLYDTPGLLVPGTLTQLLTPEELKVVVPSKKVEPITFRVASGKAVLVGGLAKIELIDDSRPFLFSFFVANGIKLHPTDSTKADNFIAQHVGGMLTPPFEPGPQRMEQLGEFESHVINVTGVGWKEAAADITLTGLGWVAVTGAGEARVKVSVPKGIGISLRPPLMPFDVWESTARYTGNRAVRKISKTRSGKRNRGVGRN